MNDCEKKHVIMKAAERLFKSRRFHEVTTDDIAAEANVGKGTIYRFFRDKDDLFLQMAVAGLEELCELVEAQGTAQRSFEACLDGACRQIGEFFERRRQLFRVLQAEENRLQWARGVHCQKLGQKRQRLLAAIGAILTQGTAEGKVRDDVPAQVLAVYLLGLVRTRFRHLHELSEGWRDSDVAVRLFLRGVGRTPTAANDAAPGAAISVAAARPPGDESRGSRSLR